MSELIKKKDIQPIVSKYSVPVTSEMKKKLDELRDEKDYDVNEMLRHFAQQIIQQAETEQTAS